MAQRLRSAARRAVERARVAPGDHVLDVACGTGNAAVAAAERGADRVVGVDLEPGLLLVAAERRPDVTWLEGDACALPEDARPPFDAVLSVFGVMYAGDHAAAARELARMTKPATGRVVLANWTPASFLPALGAAVAPFLPAAPEHGEPPSRWGDPASVTPLLHAAGLDVVATQPESLVLSLPDRTHALAFLVQTAGQVMAQRARLQREGRWGQLLAAVGGLVAQRDAGIEGRVALKCDYLLIEARRAPTPERA
jgi:SAM-dependent methyltransferase